MVNKGQPKEYYEYVMPAHIAKAYLNARRGDELKMNPWDYLCEVVNKHMGLNKECVKVTVIG